MINRKQIATMTLAAATILTSIPVMADDNTNVVTGNPTSVDTRVEATVPSSYQITVPKKITLTVTKDSSNGGYTGYADYKVNVQGDIAANEIITVTPMKDTIELNQSGKTSKSATVALDANELDSAAISGAAGKDVSGTVIASGLTAGSWSGTAGFSVNVVEKYGEDITINDPSTYGIPTSGDVTIPSVVTDSNGVKHRVTSNGVKTLKLDIPLVLETRINWGFVPLHIAIIYILKLCLGEEIIPRCRFPCSRGYLIKCINWQKKQSFSVSQSYRKS